jgi:hypothetical protein
VFSETASVTQLSTGISVSVLGADFDFCQCAIQVTVDDSTGQPLTGTVPASHSVAVRPSVTDIGPYSLHCPAGKSLQPEEPGPRHCSLRSLSLILSMSECELDSLWLTQSLKLLAIMQSSAIIAAQKNMKSSTREFHREVHFTVKKVREVHFKTI